MKKKYIRFWKFFVALFCLQAAIAFNRDFLSAHRYANFQSWSADIVPALLGLITAAAINSLIVWGIYRGYKAIFKGKTTPASQ